LEGDLVQVRVPELDEPVVHRLRRRIRHLDFDDEGAPLRVWREDAAADRDAWLLRGRLDIPDTEPTMLLRAHGVILEARRSDLGRAADRVVAEAPAELRRGPGAPPRAGGGLGAAWAPATGRPGSSTCGRDPACRARPHRTRVPSPSG